MMILYHHCGKKFDSWKISRAATKLTSAPSCCRNLTRGGTIMISQGFTLEKKKLYRSYLE